MWKTDRRKALLITLVAALVAAGFLALAVRIVYALATPGDASAISADQQATAAISSGDLTKWPTDTPGVLPLNVVPVSEFMSQVSDPATAPDTVYISAAGNTAAFLIGPADAPTGITAARLVAGQDLDLVNATSGVAIDVVDPVQMREAHAAFMSATSDNSAYGLLTLLVIGGLLTTLIAFVVMRARRRVRLQRDIDGDVGTFGGAIMAGRSRGQGTTVEEAEIPKTRFSDVAGCNEALEDLAEIVDFLKDREKFAAVGATPPAGAVLVGPPGTGKTLLARAVAGEAGVPFFAVAGSDFVEKYVGVGAGRVRALFAKARKCEGGAIVFIDEVDAVGRARGGNNAHPEQENTLNALLVEMDGFRESNIIVLAATNRHDMLDKALTRPGRLDREVQVPLPDRLGREAILAVHAKDRPIAADVDYTLVARRTPGMSGAELARVVNEACLVAVRDNRKEVTNADFDQAIATASMGRARTSAVVTDHDREITAWHEAGHTLCAMLQPDADPPVSVSIIPRGPAGGVTWMAQGDDQFLTRKRAHARLIVALGGRAAEEILLDGEYTSGAYGDLTSASRLAFAMVTQYGMTDAGLMVRDEGLLGAATAATDASVQKVEQMLADARESARALLTANFDLLQAVSLELLDRDNLNASDLEEIRARVEAARATT